MIKNKLEMIRDGKPKVLITWHKRDESGEVIPVAVDFLDEVEPEMRAEIEKLALQPVYAVVDGVRKRMAPGTAAHFSALPRVLGRLGFRVRQF